MGGSTAVQGLDAMPGFGGNGESFTANVWFSTFKEGLAPKLASIIVEVTDEAPATSQEVPAEASNANSLGSRDREILSSRETEVLRLLVRGLANKEVAALDGDLGKCCEEHHPATVFQSRCAHSKPIGSSRARTVP
jgi:hypothetical protein